LDHLPAVQPDDRKLRFEMNFTSTKGIARRVARRAFKITPLHRKRPYGEFSFTEVEHRFAVSSIRLEARSRDTDPGGKEGALRSVR
jgi:hypothetical protein